MKKKGIQQYTSLSYFQNVSVSASNFNIQKCFIIFINLFFLHNYMMVYVFDFPSILHITFKLKRFKLRWLVYHGCFKFALVSLGKFSHSSRSEIVTDNIMIFSYFISKIMLFYSLESPRWGDSDYCTHHTYHYFIEDRKIILKLSPFPTCT